MKRTALLAILIFVAASAARATSLGSIDVRFRGLTMGKNARLHYTPGGLSSRTTAGQMDLQIRPSSATGTGGQAIVDQANTQNRLVGYCTDLAQYANKSWSHYGVNTVNDAPIGGDNQAWNTEHMGPAKAEQMARLFAAHADEVVDDGTAAAFQLAVWEIAYERSGVYDITAGEFYTSTNSSWVNIANPWLGSVFSGPTTGMLALTHLQDQDYVVQAQVPGVVPEPVTIASVSGCCLAVGLYMRKRRKTA